MDCNGSKVSKRIFMHIFFEEEFDKFIWFFYFTFYDI